jgi:hypothetical protein
MPDGVHIPPLVVAEVELCADVVVELVLLEVADAVLFEVADAVLLDVAGPAALVVVEDGAPPAPPVDPSPSSPQPLARVSITPAQSAETASGRTEKKAMRA